jgi:hypothetical protein
VNLTDGEYGSAEFSDLYLRLLSAALDETNSSLSSRTRESNLNAHVARGISMADMALRQCTVRDNAHPRTGHEETPFL